MKVIDISKWQGENFPFVEMKEAGYDGCMVRVGYGTTDDRLAISNIEGALAAGMHVGVYLYSLAKDKASGKREVDFILNKVKPFISRLMLGVAIDVETGLSDKSVEVFNYQFEELSKSFKNVWLYTNQYLFNRYFGEKTAPDALLWIARYNTVPPEIGATVDMWQYTSSVDANEPYKKPLDRSVLLNEVDERVGHHTGKSEEERYSAIVSVVRDQYGKGDERKKGLAADGFDPEEIQREVNRYWNAAIDVLAGKYGNQPKRRARVEVAGYDYETVRAIVNHMSE